MKPTLTPYLNFNGQTGEAMKFYQSVLGGELKMQTFGETGMPCADEDKNKIMHADLKNDALSFMASDGNKEHVVTMGDNINMSIVGNEEALLTKHFNALAEGGKVDMPLAKQFWGDIFGMCTDKFGVHWMVNIMSVNPTETPQK
jgi:PhnB protein